MGKVEFATPDYDFLEQMKWNVKVFSAFKTHRQQNELYGKMFDKEGKVKPFDQFRKDSETVLNNYNVNWLRTEYDTCITRARFAADFHRYQSQTDLYSNLQWSPSVAVEKRETYPCSTTGYGLLRIHSGRPTIRVDCGTANAE